MSYDSPKQIRHRQQVAEDRAARPRRTRKIKVPTDAEREAFFTFHFGEVERAIQSGDAIKAGVHARTAIHGALQHRALEIQRDFGRAYWKAMRMAREELYGSPQEFDFDALPASDRIKLAEGICELFDWMVAQAAEQGIELPKAA